MSNYLVTGGAGFIGSHIATALVERGDQVAVLDNLSTGRRENLAHLQGRDYFPPGRSARPRAARKGFGWGRSGVSPGGPRLRAAERGRAARYERGLRDRHGESARRGPPGWASGAWSMRVPAARYGDQPFMSKRETDLPAPLSPYAAAKLAAESYCQAFYATYGLETVVIRYFNVFGPRQDPASEYSAVIPLFVTAMLQGRQPTVFGDGTQSRDFTYIDNVVHGNLAAATADRAAGRVFNVACGGQQSLLELIDAINEVLGTAIEPVFAERRPGDVRESLADITAARDVLGYEPEVDFVEGLRRSIDYYRSLG